MACMLAVLLQETGRVMEAPFWLSYAIRACPIVCVFDTFMMLLKFLVMLAVGCSPQTAARHVWYDRFDQDLDDATTEGLVEHWSPFFSTASDTTIEAVPSSNPHAYSDHDEDEYMCSGALPVGSIQEHGSVDLPLVALRNSDGLSISRYSDTPIVPSIDVAEVAISVGEELERPDEETSTAVLDGAVNTSVEGDEIIADTTIEVTATSPLPNAFMVTPNYMVPPPGSTLDRGWRVSMISFMLGAFPQAIKVFAMRGIVCTQVLVTIFLVAFIVPELLRSLAGPVGQSNLYPLPIISNAKSFLSSGLFSTVFWWSSFFYMFPLVVMASAEPLGFVSRVSMVPIGMVIAFPITLLLYVFIIFLTCFKIFASCSNGLRLYMYNFRVFRYVRIKLAVFIAGSLALKHSTVEPWLSFVCLYTICLGGTLWRLWCASLFPLESEEAAARVSSIVFWSFAPLGPYIVYRLLFVGYMSAITRHLCGTRGTTRGFFKGIFVVINIAGLTVCYARLLYTSSGTFKPRWVEVLG